MKYKYGYDDDLGIEYADEGPWRSYELETHGNTREELFTNATISEVDQDGGEIRCYGYYEAGYDVSRACYKVIEGLLHDTLSIKQMSDLVIEKYKAVLEKLK